MRHSKDRKAEERFRIKIRNRARKEEERRRRRQRHDKQTPPVRLPESVSFGEPHIEPTKPERDKS